MNEYRERALQDHEGGCELCPATEELVVHHITGDRTINTLDNLLVVCRTCHGKIHGGADGFEEWTERLLPREKLPRHARLDPYVENPPEKISIDVYADTLAQIRQHLREGETIDDVLKRAVPDPKPSLTACDNCGDAMVTPAYERGSETYCHDCASGIAPLIDGL
jgi:hypothetical protein